MADSTTLPTETSDVLNPAQRAAVEAPDGPALVLAGAGSGKTRVIVERILHLMEARGVPAYRILGLTFTNRAAGEMRERVGRRLKVDRPEVWLGTFHSFGLYVLRREITRLGRTTPFTVFDDADQLALMKRLVKAHGAQHAGISPRNALNWISRCKQDLDEPDIAEAGDEAEALRLLWNRYHETLRAASALDFDDLLVLTARLFEEDPEALEKYRGRFPYLLVDEYQDTNRAQYAIARALAGPSGNLFVVGDEDQSIYSWRGADINNILDFEGDFPGAVVYRLEQNYRSTKPILSAANAVVSHNEERLGKTLWTDRKGGDRVRFHLAADGLAEAAYIVDSIRDRKLPPSGVAVLYRTNGQARVVEEAFLRRGIAYTVVGGVRFYARKEIKDLLGYLRLVVNPADEEALRRIINVPPRGLGAQTVARLEDAARRRHVTLFQALRDAEEDAAFTTRARQAVAELAMLIDDLALELRSAGTEELATRLLAETGYRDYVQKTDERDFRTRLEVVDEFLTACRQFDAREEGGIEEFLNELSLMGEADEYRAGTPAATLLTCHSAKGLEFDHVYLIGLEEGFLPHANASDSPEAIEEERRLCYVAMTRARESLTVTAAKERVVFGAPSTRDLSRFVQELPRGEVDWHLGGAAEADEAERAAGGTIDALKMGTRVRHAKFGKGVVMYSSGTGDRLKVRIRFDTGTSRQFMVRHAPLEVLDRP